MRWLWLVGPLTVLFVYLLLILFPSRTERRWREQVRLWIDEYLGPIVTGDKRRSRRVKRLPLSFEAAAQRAGGGSRVTDVVLVSKIAYAAVRAADGQAGSEQQSVMCRLEKSAPSMLVRPLVVIDDRAAENSGLDVGDEAFTDLFVVQGEGPDADAISDWLDDDVRSALSEMPELWLRTEGKMMTLSLYGEPDAERLDEMVAIADTLFAIYGADPDVTLCGEPLKDPPQKEAASSTAKGEVSLRDRLLAGALDVGLYAVAIVLCAAVLGQFDGYHPRWMFKSPLRVVTEPWQGGWTTKGVGALVAVQALVIGLFVGQSFLASTRGRSIGKYVLGLQVERLDGAPMDFCHGALRRSWLILAVPLLTALAMARPLSLRGFLLNVPTLVSVGIVTGVMVAIMLPLLAGKSRAIHDQLSATRVVTAPAWRSANIQLLSERGVDPIVRRQVLVVLSLMALWCVVYWGVATNPGVFSRFR
jgi:uncharacterized RDD family membrane protein YckC